MPTWLTGFFPAAASEPAGLLSGIIPLGRFPLPTCPQSPSSADVPSTVRYMPPMPLPLLSRVFRSMLTDSTPILGDTKSVTASRTSSFRLKYSFSLFMYLSTKAMAMVRCRSFLRRIPMTFTSSPVSG